MTVNINKTIPSEKDARSIFEKQREQFALTEEEKTYIDKLGLADKDFSSLDFFSENSLLDILANMSLEESASLNDGADYNSCTDYDDYTKAEIAASCLDKLYEHIGTNSIDEKMIDLNEKLLCFAEGDDLINAITCMGLQLAKFNRNNNEVRFDNQPGETGLMLNFYHNLARTVTDWKSMDADTQMTLATEAHLIEDEANIIENITYIYSDIIERLNKAENYVPSDPEKLFRPQLSEITVNVVKMHYEYIYSAYETNR